VATKLILLWAIGRPEDPRHPDTVARMLGAVDEAECRPNAGPKSAPTLADREARLDQVARTSAQETRAACHQRPDSTQAVGQALVARALDASAHRRKGVRRWHARLHP
jgi:hypothetical protein